MAEQKPEFKHIVRIANTDLDGNKPIGHNLTKIKGVNFMFANMVLNFTGVDRAKKAGELSEDDIKKLNDFLMEPLKHGAPEWMLNRRNDYYTGETTHLLTGNIVFVRENDIKRLKKIRAYRGVRHIQGLPTRGQRTRSNFRKNKGKVSLGVRKSKESQAPKPAEKEKKKGKD